MPSREKTAIATRLTPEAGEDSLVDWLGRLLTPLGSERLIGDDAAILPVTPGAGWAISTDSQIEGTHFVAGVDPAIVAQRLLSVNLSDMAAMGATPRYAFLALAAPALFDHRRFFKALARAARHHQMRVAGGDLAKSPHVHATMTIVGEKGAARWLRRSDARPGDDLWVGGTLGESAAGAVLVATGARWIGRTVELPASFSKSGSVQSAAVAAAARRAIRRHLRPRPQLELGRFLAALPAGAAMDVSDGLTRDLHRLCRASKVGAEIFFDALPAPPRFGALCEVIRRNPRELQLAGGEDYVLLFTLPQGTKLREVGAHLIGRIRRRRGVDGVSGAERFPLEPRGWDHLAPPSHQ